MSKISPLAAIFFSMSFILAHFLHNISELSLDVLPVPILFSVLFGLLVVGLSFLLFKDKSKASAFSSVFIICFFFYGQIAAYVKYNPIFFLAWLVLQFVAYKIIKKSTVSIKITQYLLITSIIVLIFPAIQILSFQWNRNTRPISTELIEINKPSGISKSSYPDIYYLMPDSYSASKSLQKYYGFSNNSFEDFLSANNFFIASKSASNYPKTFLSLASSLNMQYLAFLSAHKNSSDLALVDPIIKQNLVVNNLKALGYNYYHLGSWWGATHFSAQADKNYLLEDKRVGGIGAFNYIILQSTALNPLFKHVLPRFAVGNSEDDQRSRVIYQFESLNNVASLPGPKFVFAHIISPHEPYVFNPDCTPISLEQTRAFKEEENYIRQVQCINNKFEQTIKTILKKSTRPTVIIIQSDEGAPFLAERLNPPDSWGQAGSDLLKEKFPVFAAIRMSTLSTTQSGLYAEISPVNIFRLVFNNYFKSNLELLPDRHYIFPNLKNLYQFEDISEVLTKE